MTENKEVTPAKPAQRFIRMKPFPFVMLVFGLVLLTAVVTFFALTVGEDKVVEVVSPQSAERDEFKKLYFVYDELQKKYLHEVDADTAIEGAINGMVDALGDPYTDYLNQEEAQRLTESISSTFEGIGAEIRESDNYIRIVSPIKNSPAEKAGLLPNDLIMAVDDESIQGLSSSEAVLLIRGEKGSEVRLKVQRGDNTEPFEVTVTRDVIPIESVYPEMVDDKVGHIRITSFAQNTYDELLEAIESLGEQGAEGFVIDVRQNPGGRLDTAKYITDLFVEKGKPIFQQTDKSGTRQITEASGGTKINVPITLLIDDGSASASEILAGAIKESTDYPIIGLKSFGKGTVQTPEELKDGSMLKLTTANWLTPKGNHIHEKGIEPDIKVDYPEYASLPFIDPAVPLKRDMISSSVEVAKKLFIAIGYDIPEVNSQFDASLQRAVEQLQREGELEVTGELQGDTTFLLMQKVREQMTEDDPQLKKATEVLYELMNK